MSRITGNLLTLEQLERLLSRIHRESEADCWEWQGALTPDGYGCIVWRRDGRQVRLQPHRLAWEFFNGRPIPEGLELDHLCGNRRCCRPEHLQPTCHAENMRRISWRLVRDYQLRLQHLDAIQGEV